MSKADALHKLSKENQQLKDEIAGLRLVVLSYAKGIVEPEKLDSVVLDSIKIHAYLQIAGEAAKNECRWENIAIHLNVGDKRSFHYPKHRQVGADFPKQFNALNKFV